MPNPPYVYNGNLWSGSQWYNGAGVPNPNQGKNGDFFLRTDTDEVYTKVAGVWVVTQDLTGSTGNTGFTGSQGFLGPQGLQGFTGSTGFTGSSGAFAAVGFTGSKGDVGATGFTGSQGFLGPQGLQGFTGSTGFTGSSGAFAAVGFTGSLGFTGSQGDIGYTGSQGIGFTGSQGIIGFTGSQGVIGFTGSVSNVSATITFNIDGLGAVIQTGVRGDLEVPFNCTITSVRLFADLTGSVVLDIYKSNYASFPPTAGNSICGAAKPTLSSASKYQDTTLTGWTTSITQGDILRFNIDSASTITKLTVSLTVSRF